MNKGKQILYTILGIICVGILFCAAMSFPKYYNVFYDKKTLNQITYMDVSFRAFETSYETFAEKIAAIAHCDSEGIDLQAVQVDEMEVSMDDEKLTTIVKQELKVLYDKNVLTKKMAVSENKLSLREMYTLYTANDTENIKGINYWKIGYDMKNYSITVLLDAEYHKIYNILVKVALDSIIKERVSASSGNTSSTATDSSDGFAELEWIPINREFTVYAYGIADYYGIVPIEIYGDYFEKQIIIIENEKCEIVQKVWRDDEYLYWEGGIPLEEKIQF